MIAGTTLYWILFIGIALISWAVSASLERKFKKYAKEPLRMTGKEVAEKVPVLFGGSVNASNAGGYLTVPGVNGLLVGGASLILNEFTDIIEVAKRVKS